MPLTSSTPITTQTATQFRIGTFRADSRGTDWVAVLFEMSSDGQTWALLREVTWDGTKLAAVMTDAANRIKTKIASGVAPALAYRDGTREATYARAQADGILPSGAGVTIS